jgi:hypothetical protein
MRSVPVKYKGLASTLLISASKPAPRQHRRLETGAGFVDAGCAGDLPEAGLQPG